jgi:membrane protease YdiL (CAAX protease family)
VSEVELPTLGQAARNVLLGAPFLLLALRRASGMLPRRPAQDHRWTGNEIVAVSLAPLALFVLIAALLRDPGVLASLLLNELVFGLTVALAVVLAARRGGLASLGLTERVEPRSLLVGPLVFVPLLLVSMGLTGAWMHVCRARGWEEHQEVLLAIVDLEGVELAVAAGIAVLVGPLLEELLFRGFLQSAMAQRLGERGALLGSSVLFAALHGMPALPGLFALSLFLGWLQQRTRCILVPWSAHVLNNAVTVGLALASKDLGG